MTDTTRVRTRYRLHRLFRGRWLILLAILVAVGAYALGLNIGYLDIAGARQAIQQLRAENQKLKIQITELNATQVALQNKLSTFEAALDEVIPAKNTYNIKPNQSMIVASGKLTIALVGPPSNDSLNVNINGKQHTAASGDTISIALDQQTTCLVRVQSFDMFKAVLQALCPPQAK